MCITAPWLGVASWTASGKGAGGDPVRAHGRRSQAEGGGYEPIVVSLPKGFGGSLHLLDKRQMSFGRIAVAQYGTDAFSALSNDLDVQLVDNREILVSHRAMEARCYISLPPALGATSVQLVNASGLTETLPLSSARGASFKLPPRFSGELRVLNAAGQTIVKARIERGGQRNAPVQVSAPPGCRAQVLNTGAMLQITVTPAGSRLNIL